MSHVYFFADGKADGDGSMKGLLGGKGAGLAEMTNLGLPVPPGFTIDTEACVHYFKTRQHAEGLREQVSQAMERLEAIMGKRFGDVDNPLLVSVRSGARVSMPGMMDTVLNLGLNDDTVKGLEAGGERFAWDSYRRFIQMYGDVVMGIEHDAFEKAIEAVKQERGVTSDTELTAADLRGLVDRYKAIVEREAGRPFPTAPDEQLWGAIDAVFASWDNDRAKAYRKMEGIGDDWGTAVNVQAMVFGNMGDDCATGVLFTRNPSTGAPGTYGEYLVNAQGEDVVAGTRDALPMSGEREDALEQVMPESYRQLSALQEKLELHYRDMQDIEFTVERGKLFMLQTRTGKRTAAAAVRIAVDMVDEGVIDETEAVRRVKPSQIEILLHPRLDPDAERTVLATGVGASPGAASGRLAFTAEDAIEMALEGPVILMRPETSPEDISGMNAARGIATARGGATSHAAVVARGLGRTCVSGCSALRIDLSRRQVTIGDEILREGDWVTLEGTQGWVLKGEVPTIPPDPDERFKRLMGWADQHRRLKVRANADTPEDSRRARELGAEGIGLCRTEHMFFEHVDAMRHMILADSKEQRRAALARLLPIQRKDFIGIFREMKGLPVTIRLLDPPLHEFLPHDGDDILALAEQIGVDEQALKARVASLREVNPMLGHRGCRLAISYPEVAEMQVEAIISAACQLVKDEGFHLIPEIMIPLVGMSREIEVLRERVVAVADRVIGEHDVALEYLVGTMIELPRAALVADEIAAHADFFSFGTNDLTQTTFGISRDDSANFLPAYVEQGILAIDPFARIDPAVGELVRMASEKGRAARPDLKLGICGEHGGEPVSVAFFHRVGLDYVSCSPFRVPVARMAAAHAALEDR